MYGEGQHRSVTASVWGGSSGEALPMSKWTRIKTATLKHGQAASNCGDRVTKESHPCVLTEPYVKVFLHTALLVYKSQFNNSMDAQTASAETSWEFLCAVA